MICLIMLMSLNGTPIYITDNISSIEILSHNGTSVCYNSGYNRDSRCALVKESPEEVLKKLRLKKCENK